MNQMAPMTVGKKIRDLRQKNKLMQRELAEHLSVTSSTISNWENERRLPSIKELKKLAQFFNISLSVFDLKDQAFQVIDDEPKLRELNLSVECKHLGFPLSKLDLFVLALALAFVFTGFFLSSDFALIVYFIGVFGIMWTLFSYGSKRFKQIRSNNKKLLVPIKNNVLYVHALKEDTIETYMKRSRLMVLILFILSIVQYGSIIALFQALDSLAINLVVSFYALLAIFVSFYRYNALHHHSVLAKRVPYYDISKGLIFYSFSIGFVVDALTFAAYALILIIYRSEFARMEWIATLVLFISMITVFLSYGFLAKYQDFIARFALYSIDENGERIRLN